VVAVIGRGGRGTGGEPISGLKGRRVALSWPNAEGPSVGWCSILRVEKREAVASVVKRGALRAVFYRCRGGREVADWWWRWGAIDATSYHH
jgi:hypothetical protein